MVLFHETCLLLDNCYSFVQCYLYLRQNQNLIVGIKFFIPVSPYPWNQLFWTKIMVFTSDNQVWWSQLLTDHRLILSGLFPHPASLASTGEESPPKTERHRTPVCPSRGKAVPRSQPNSAKSASTPLTSTQTGTLRDVIEELVLITLAKFNKTPWLV